MDEDAGLLEALHQGDRNAWDQILPELRKLALRSAYRPSLNLDHADADDCAQQAIVQVMES